MVRSLVSLSLLSALVFALAATVSAQMGSNSRSGKSAEKELRAFYDSYADDIRQHRPDAIAKKYDSDGVWFLGNGAKRHSSFEDNKKYYTTKWKGPKNFDFKDLTFELTDARSAVVFGKFEWQAESDDKPTTCSYTGILHRNAGKWLIRVEHESCPPK